MLARIFGARKTGNSRQLVSKWQRVESGPQGGIPRHERPDAGTLGIERNQHDGELVHVRLGTSPN
jgi:hypothetical protein